MKAIKVIKNETNLQETHILGDLCATDKLCDYEFPAFSGFYAYIRLDEYNMLGIDNGHLFIFLDLLGYYSEEYGEYSLVPMAYYTNDELTTIFDSFNEENKLDDIDSMYMLDDGEGIEINSDGSIKITDESLLKFFLNFDNDIKEVDLFINKLTENKFEECGFKIKK